MSRLRMIPGGKIEDLLGAAPGALEADSQMRRVLITKLTARLYSMIGIAVAGCLRCEEMIADLRGSFGHNEAMQIARDWRTLDLPSREKVVLTYAEKGTLDEAAVRKKDVDQLRAAGFSDSEVLLIATAIAYHNYAIRMAAAFGVAPR